ncbi:MAG: hypothetical protein IPJ37_19045 [Bacteroidales bacterium]|nr:hypothetical protein [Bacteroidales bacterium]
MKYFDDKGLKNVFQLIEQTCNSETLRWIGRAKQELNRYASYLCLITRFEKETIDKNIVRAVYESIASCSTSIVFSLYNIFAILTKTEKTFFDNHIEEYFSGVMKLNHEDSYCLQFRWHEPVEQINSLTFDNDKEAIVCHSGNCLFFKIKNSISHSSLQSTNITDSDDIIFSKDFFSINLLNILAVTDLLAALLSDKKLNKNVRFLLAAPDCNSYLQIDNIALLKSVLAESIIANL